MTTNKPRDVSGDNTYLCFIRLQLHAVMVAGGGRGVGGG